jgi:hypothetical protein
VYDRSEERGVGGVWSQVEGGEEECRGCLQVASLRSTRSHLYPNREVPRYSRDTGCKILRCWVQTVAGAKMLGAKTALPTI